MPHGGRGYAGAAMSGSLWILLGGLLLVLLAAAYALIVLQWATAIACSAGSAGASADGSTDSCISRIRSWGR